MFRINIFIILSILLMTSCEDNGYWSEGEEISNKVSFDNFQSLEIKSIFDIEMVSDTVNFAIVKCGKNLIENVKLECKNQVLSLSQSTEPNWTRSYKHTEIELHYKTISAIQIKNSVKLSSQTTIKCFSLSIEDVGELSELDIEVDCVNFSLAVLNDNCGIYKVRGKAINNTLTMHGSSHFHTESLLSDSVNISHKGIGDCLVNATRLICGTNFYNGTIKYINQAGVRVEVINKYGKVIPIF